MRVRVLHRGYFGGMIRDTGEKFEMPDEIMNDEALRPSWVEPVSTKLAMVDDDGPDDDDNGQELAPPAKGADKPKNKGGRPKKTAPETEAKDDEPKGNGIAEALGSPPDWLPPGGADALKGDDE